MNNMIAALKSGSSVLYVPCQEGEMKVGDTVESKCWGDRAVVALAPDPDGRVLALLSLAADVEAAGCWKVKQLAQETA